MFQSVTTSVADSTRIRRRRPGQRSISGFLPPALFACALGLAGCTSTTSSKRQNARGRDGGPVPVGNLSSPPAAYSRAASAAGAGESEGEGEMAGVLRTLGPSSNKGAAGRTADAARTAGQATWGVARGTYNAGRGIVTTAAGASGAAFRTVGNVLPGALGGSGGNGGGYQVTARPGQVGPGGLCWPVVGRVSRGFNLDINHKGIDICAPTGTSVYAARTGRVVYSGNKLSGFGNVVIMEHGNGLATLYAHNSRLLVHAGQYVRQGQEISKVGQTGTASGPHCHFELRFNTTPVDAKPYLP